MAIEVSVISLEFKRRKLHYKYYYRVREKGTRIEWKMERYEVEVEIRIRVE